MVAHTWPSEHGAPIGTAHPLVSVAVDPQARWVVALQAREDSDGDGEIEVLAGRAGWIGDRMRPWLLRGEGPGKPLDWFGGADPSGR